MSLTQICKEFMTVSGSIISLRGRMATLGANQCVSCTVSTQPRAHSNLQSLMHTYVNKKARILTYMHTHALAYAYIGKTVQEGWNFYVGGQPWP